MNKLKIFFRVHKVCFQRVNSKTLNKILIIVPMNNIMNNLGNQISFHYSCNSHNNSNNTAFKNNSNINNNKIWCRKINPLNKTMFLLHNNKIAKKKFLSQRDYQRNIKENKQKKIEIIYLKKVEKNQMNFI